MLLLVLILAFCSRESDELTRTSKNIPHSVNVNITKIIMIQPPNQMGMKTAPLIEPTVRTQYYTVKSQERDLTTNTKYLLSSTFSSEERQRYQTEVPSQYEQTLTSNLTSEQYNTEVPSQYKQVPTSASSLGQYVTEVSSGQKQILTTTSSSDQHDMEMPSRYQQIPTTASSSDQNNMEMSSQYKQVSNTSSSDQYGTEISIQAPSSTSSDQYGTEISTHAPASTSPSDQYGTEISTQAPSTQYDMEVPSAPKIPTNASSSTDESQQNQMPTKGKKIIVSTPGYGASRGMAMKQFTIPGNSTLNNTLIVPEQFVIPRQKPNVTTQITTVSEIDTPNNITKSSTTTDHTQTTTQSSSVVLNITSTYSTARNLIDVEDMCNKNGYIPYTPPTRKKKTRCSTKLKDENKPRDLKIKNLRYRRLNKETSSSIHNRRKYMTKTRTGNKQNYNMIKNSRNTAVNHILTDVVRPLKHTQQNGLLKSKDHSKIEVSSQDMEKVKQSETTENNKNLKEAFKRYNAGDPTREELPETHDDSLYNLIRIIRNLATKHKRTQDMRSVKNNQRSKINSQTAILQHWKKKKRKNKKMIENGI
ncbi:uncharacterized protein [Periplaneta americana]|uniref:uncharacterized protein isoform X2 n=1 Tax=Periplaneta americana TaxID=6978 RepID=UPI0037E8D360